MDNFLSKIKSNFILILNVVLPFAIFFIPLYYTTYVDELEATTFYYNFYNLINFKNELLFSLLFLLFILIALINMIIFILFIIDNYKLLIYKRLLNILSIINNVLFCLLSLGFLIFAAVRSIYSNNVLLNYNNGFYAGSVILLTFSIICLLFLIRKLKKEKNGHTF